MRHTNYIRGILATVLLLCSAASWAYDFKVDGIYYNVLSSEDLTCEVTYYSTSGTNYSGEISIPETVTRSDGTVYTVVGIGYCAFYYSGYGGKITDITIPSTVTYIDSLAFYRCSGLTEITVPRSVTSIGGRAFYDCSGLMEIDIPNGIDVIRTYTFYGCSALKKVTIPNSVTSIWGSAFEGCKSLTDVTIPSSVTYIGTEAFSRCTSLAAMTLEDGEETLTLESSSSSNNPLYNCSALNTLYLGRDISYTGSYSPFREKTTLSSLTIGNKVTHICTYEFYGCTALAGLTLPESITSLETYAFYNCSGMEGVLDIPNSVTSIGSYAFHGCSGLSEISVGKGVTSIGNYAFRGCAPEEMFFYARLDDYNLVFNNMTCGTLYAYEDQIEAIKSEYSGTVLPLEDVYSLSLEDAYPRSVVLGVGVKEKLMTDGVSLQSVRVGRTDAVAGADGLYVAKDLLPNTEYTCTLTFLYDTKERTDELTVTTEDFWDEATVQSVAPLSASFLVILKEDPYSSQPDEYGIVYGSTYYPAEADGTVTATGLLAETEYSFEVYAKYEDVIMRSGSVVITTPEIVPPTVLTASATNITATSATMNGSAEMGTEEILEQGFEYWTADGDVNVIVVTDDKMSVTLTDLTPGTTYTYRTYTKTKYGGITYGEDVSFTTLVIAPTVQTVTATDITYSSATLSGTVTAGSEAIEEQGFEYRAATSSSTDVLTITGTGEEMSVTITNLVASTTYIYCAYVMTASKTYYGEEKAFTTAALIAPTVQTNSASDITTTTAVLNGHVEKASEEIEEQGFEYRATDGEAQTVTASGEDMSCVISGLTPGTMYLYRAYATTASGITYGEYVSFTTLVVEPTVQTVTSTNITYNSATLNGTVVAGSEKIVEQGFKYRIATSSSTEALTVTGTGEEMSVTITNLEASTTYIYCAYATTASGTTYGEELTFTTLELIPPTVLTYKATDITYNSATLNGIVTAGSEEIEEHGFEYWRRGGEIQCISMTDQSMEVTITGLSFSSIYTYRAYATTASGTTYGEEVTFTTLELIPPTVQTYEATDITYNSATLNGIVTAGSEEIEEQGFEYWRRGGEIQSISMTDQLMEVTITGLSFSSIYTCRAYATTASGTTYGEEVTFTTLEPIPPIVQTYEATDISEYSATLNGSITAGDEEIVEQGFEYWANDGDVMTLRGSGEEMSVTLTGLEQNTTYTYRAYATTASRTTYGEEVTFTTLEEEFLYDFKENGIYYIITSSSTCKVTYLYPYNSEEHSNSGAYSGYVTIPETVTHEGNTYSVTSVGDHAFYSCEGLYGVSIPNTVTSIGDGAFERSGLTEVTIPEKVSSIVETSFYRCYSLAMFDVAEGNSYFCSQDGVLYTKDMKTLRQFPPASPITSYNIPESVTSIYRKAFLGCASLKELFIPESVTTIESEAFTECANLISVNIPQSVTRIELNVFYGCSSLPSVDLHEGITYIGTYAFSYCTSLKELTIPSSVKEIGCRAFWHCTGLTAVYFNAIDAEVVQYSQAPFEGCSTPATLTIGDGVTRIAEHMFESYTGITSAIIPASVTEIEDKAFYDCKGMTSVTSLNPEPPTCGEQTFYNVPTNTCVLYVPEGSKEAYSTAYVWEDFFNIEDNQPNGIADISTNGNAEPTGYYTTDGKKVPSLQRGNVYVVRYSDGTARKVLVK